MSSIKLYHFDNKPMYDMKDIYSSYLEEQIAIRSQTKLLDLIFYKIEGFHMKHGMKPDNLYLSSDDFRRLMSGLTFISGNTNVPTEFMGMKIMIIPNLSSPEVGVNDPITMLSIDFFEKREVNKD